MPRIFMPSIDKDKPVEIGGENARYLLTVLRLTPGEELTLIDQNGYKYKAEIWQTLKRETLYVRVIDTLPPDPEPAVGVVLLQGILKGQKMDLVIQKTTELGVNEIVPLLTERTQIRETRKIERWRKIALEAARQSGRAKPPGVREPITLDELPPSNEGFLFWEEGGRPLKECPLRSSKGELLIAVGPEGGFTKQEVLGAKERGLETVSLGRRILRAETAAISAVTLVQFLLGEI